MNSHSLNHIYRLVWNAVTQSWVAVAETTRGKSKPGRARRASTRSLALATALMAAGAAQADPAGGVVTSGVGRISQSANSTVIQQQSQNLQLQWQSFNVGAGQSVTFQQPSANALAVNQILDTNGSRILGNINANGQVWLINPNGVYFGKDAQVNVGGLVASTLNPMGTAADGSQSFAKLAGSATGSVVNEGKLTAAEGGYIALLGEQVRNQGVISAQLGSVALAGGSAVSLNFGGHQLLGVEVTQSTLDNLASNQQLVQANGGQVFMSAGAKNSLLASAVNNSGTIEAQTIQEKDGRIILLSGMAAGTTTVGGKLDASAPNGGKGGFIETSGSVVKVAGDAVVTTQATYGSSGTWLLDPTDFNIEAGTGASSSSIGADTLSASLASGNVTIQTDNANGTGNGDIHINAPVSWATDNTLTLSAYRDININANLTATGAAGKLALEYGLGAVAANNPATYNIRLTEAGFGAKVNLKAGNNFSTKLGSNGAVRLFTVITELGAENVATDDGTLQGLANSRVTRALKFIALGADIDASATNGWNAGQGFKPIRTGVGVEFGGTFDGLGHTIAALTINRPTENFVGLFAGTTSANSPIRNVGLVGGSVTGGSHVGALVGFANDAVFNVYSSVAVTGQLYVGGLIGHSRGEVRHVYATGNVTGVGGAGATGVGGLIGIGERVGPPDSPKLSSSYATGNVSATDTTGVGGLVGASNWAFISDSYATGNVTVTGAASAKVGGLVGDLNGMVIGSYAVGRVTSRDSSTDVGGLVGAYVNTVTPAGSITVTDSFWDTQTSGLTTSAVGTGKSTAEMKAVATFTGWNVTGNGGEYPKLVAGLNGTKPYALAPGVVWQTPVVTPVAFTLSDIGSGYTYSGGAVSLGSLWGAASIFGNTYSNWVLGTDYSFSFNGNTATSFTNAGTYAGIGVNVLKTGFLTAPSGNTTGSLTIARKAVTVSGITAADKTYDGSTSASVNTAGAVYTGLVAGEALRTTAAGVFASKNVSATAQLVSLAATTTAGANTSLSNYTVTEQASTSARITPKAVTVSGITAADKAYDGSTTASVNTANAVYNGLVAGESLQTTATGSFASKNASASAQVVNLVATTTAGANTSLSNYTVTEQASTSARINPKAVTVSGITVADKTYDGSTALTVNTAGAVYTGLVAGESLVTSATGGYADKNAGANKAVALTATTTAGANTLLGNYAVTEQTSATGTIQKKVLTVAATAADKVYDSTPTASVTLTPNGVIAGETVQVTQTAANFVDAQGVANGNVGSNKSVVVQGVGLAGNDSANYALGGVAQVDGKASITPATLTYVAAPASFILGQPLQLTGSVTGLVGSDTLASAFTGTATWTVDGDMNLPGAKGVVGGGLVAKAGNYVFTQSQGNGAALELKPGSAPLPVQAATSNLQRGQGSLPTQLTTGHTSQGPAASAYLPPVLSTTPGWGTLQVIDRGLHLPNNLLVRTGE